MDTYSLYVITIVNLLVAGGVMIYIASMRAKMAGYRNCGVGLMLTGFGLLVVVARLVIPGKTVIALSDVFLAAGAYYLVAGARAFCELRPIRPTLVLACLAAFGAAILYFLYVREDQAMRVALVSALFGGTCIHAGAVLAISATRRDRHIQILTSGAFFAIGLFLMVRMACAVNGHLVIGKLLGEGPIETAYLIVLNLSVTTCGLGLLTASNLRLTREVESLALYDALTELPNRRFFEERMAVAGKRASRTGGRLALIFVDLDGFKAINDSLGHLTGDTVLRAIGERLSEHVRESDCVARLGGDEFVLLLEDAPPRIELQSLIERLKENVSRDLNVSGQIVNPRISCGLAVYPDDVTSVDNLVGDADRAMYAAKTSARNA